MAPKAKERFKKLLYEAGVSVKEDTQGKPFPINGGTMKPFEFNTLAGSPITVFGFVSVVLCGGFHQVNGYNVEFTPELEKAIHAHNAEILEAAWLSLRAKLLRQNAPRGEKKDWGEPPHEGLRVPPVFLGAPQLSVTPEGGNQ